MRKHKPTPAELVASLKLPHLRDPNGKWMKRDGTDNDTEVSRLRLEGYAKMLLDLGISDADVSCMFSDLYWDSYEESRLNKAYELNPT